MKISFVLAGAGIVFGLLYLVSFPARASTARAVDPVRSDARANLPALNAEAQRAAGSDAVITNSINERSDAGRGVKRQGMPATQQDLDRRVRSLFLFLQILRSQK